ATMYSLYFFSILPNPPTSILFPFTTLFRSNELKDKFNTSIILVTHDLGVVANFADRVQVMYAGELEETGTRDEIFYNSKHPYTRSEEHTSELQSRFDLVCRLLLEKKKIKKI